MVNRLHLIREKLLSDPCLNLSVVLHILLLLVIFVGLPKPMRIKRPSDDMIIVLDSVPVTEFTNLKIKDTNAGSTVQNEMKKFSTVVKNERFEENLSSVEAPTHVPESKVIEEEAAPKIIKKPKVKPQKGVQTKKNIKSKPLKEDDELASLLQSLDDKTTAGSVQNSGEKSGVIGKGKSNYDERRLMGASIVNAIRGQFMRCWNVPIGAMDIQDIIITIEIELDESGNVISAQIKNRQKYAGDPFAEALEESALRAVHTCSPIKNLPKRNFKTWQKMQLSFNVKDML